MLTSCSESEDTTPSNADINRLESLLDRSITDIAEFCDKYGTYVLYDFDQRLDFAYQFEQATAWENAKLTRLDHDGAVTAMAWLKSNVFSHYSDAFKTKYLPRKFLITKRIESTSELGRSEPKSGLHSAVANINSITVGNYTDSREIDRAILADYLVNARGETPVGKEFYEFSDVYYSTLMNENRKQARILLAEDPEFFHDHGFLNPADDESTYFASARMDVVQYIDSLIGMTQELHDNIMNNENTDMLKKMAYVAHGLNDIGVNVGMLNPYAVDFLEVNVSGINPSVRFTEIPAAFTSEERVKFSVLRGENNLQKAEVYMYDELVQSFDLTQQANAPVVNLEVTLKGLKPKSNVFTVWVYEEGKTRPSAKISSSINYYATTNVDMLVIQDDNEDSFTREDYRMKVTYEDGTVGESILDNIITIKFEHKAKFDSKTFMGYDGEIRFWRMHLNAGLVDWIEEWEEVIDYMLGDNETILRHTYLFEYDEEQQLKSVKKKNIDATETIISNVNCINGEIISYDIATASGTRTYTPMYSPLNNKTRIDLMAEGLSGAYFTHSITDEENPFYIPAIPAVIPGEVAGIPLQFIYSEYLFNAITSADGTPIWTAGWELDKSEASRPFYGTSIVRGERTWSYKYLLNP